MPRRPAPVGEWTGIATRVWYACDSIGHARAELFDTAGFVGMCTASLSHRFSRCGMISGTDSGELA